MKKEYKKKADRGGSKVSRLRQMFERNNSDKKKRESLEARPLPMPMAALTASPIHKEPKKIEKVAAVAPVDIGAVGKFGAVDATAGVQVPAGGTEIGETAPIVFLEKTTSAVLTPDATVSTKELASSAAEEGSKPGVSPQNMLPGSSKDATSLKASVPAVVGSTSVMHHGVEKSPLSGAELLGTTQGEAAKECPLAAADNNSAAAGDEAQMTDAVVTQGGMNNPAVLGAGNGTFSSAIPAVIPAPITAVEDVIQVSVVVLPGHCRRDMYAEIMNALVSCNHIGFMCAPSCVLQTFILSLSRCLAPEPTGGRRSCDT